MADAKEAAPTPPEKVKVRRLDRTKAYAFITPPVNGAVYDQDGAQFSSDGALVHEDRPPTPPKKTVTETFEVDETGKTTVTQTEEEEPGGQLEDRDPKEMLKDWITGEVKINQFLAVRNLVKKAYNQLPGGGTKEEIVAFLVNEAHLVSAEAVKV